MEDAVPIQDATPNQPPPLITADRSDDALLSNLAGSDQPIVGQAGGLTDLAARRMQRQQEFLAAKLADPDPRAAVLGAAAVEVLEFGATLRTTLVAVLNSASDPQERLESLMPGLRMFGNLVRLAERLS